MALVVFVISAALVVRAATRLVSAGDEIAERTGLGGLLVGTLLLAFATSLPELAVDVTAAATGAPDLAVADLFGSSMANMAILAIIDLRHRGRLWPAVELGHARVAAVAIALTALAGIGIHTPQGLRIGWIGATPILIFALYIAAIAWFRRAPSLSRTNIAQTGLRLQEPIGWSTEEGAVSLRRVAARFVAASLVILASAPIMTVSVERIAEISGITQTSGSRQTLAAQ